MIDYTAARTAMVDGQIRPSDVTKFPIIQAFLATKREVFIPQDMQEIAYVGDHLALSSERMLLDARILAKMLEATNIQPNEMVLDIACGMGYSTAIIAHLAEAVVGIESDPTLVAKATENLANQSIDNAVIIKSDLTKAAPKHGPYDVIILQGSVEKIPETLLQQLNNGGRICAIFSTNQSGICRIGYKNNDKITWRNNFDATAPALAGFQLSHEFNFF